LRLIESIPYGGVLVVPLNHILGVVDEIGHNLLACPRSVAVKKGKRCVPVEEGDHSLDAVPFQIREEVVVMLDTLLVYRSAAEWEDASPADAEAVGLNAKVLQAQVVLLVEVWKKRTWRSVGCQGQMRRPESIRHTVAVRSNISGGVVRNSIDPSVGEQIPDGRALALGVGSALDLQRGRRDAPEEVVRKDSVGDLGDVGGD